MTGHDTSWMQRIYRAWDEAMAAGDVERLVRLYAEDAEIESPLIHEFTQGRTGVLRGRAEFTPLYAEVTRRQSSVIRPPHHDDGVARGNRLIWEYPRLGAGGEQSEFTEIWDFADNGEIASHRVYWGWSRIARMRRQGFAPG